MRGAVALEEAWLAKDSSKSVAVYVVWVPRLGAEEKHVASATALVPDHRARHFWDGGMLIGSAYQPVLKLEAAAWDTWMLFDQEAVWKDAPPAPAWWEHQLSNAPPELHLDPDRFASHAEALHLVTAEHR